MSQGPVTFSFDLDAAFLDYLRNDNYRREPDGTVTFPARRGILTADGVHFSQRGKELAARLVADGIVRVLAER